MSAGFLQRAWNDACFGPMFVCHDDVVSTLVAVRSFNVHLMYDVLNKMSEKMRVLRVAVGERADVIICTFPWESSYSTSTVSWAHSGGLVLG